MRDARKFCRPKITKNPKIGDVYIKLKCGETAPISAEEYNKVKEFFKLDSVVGSSPSIGGNLIVKSKLLGVLTVISPEDFDPDIFEVLEVIGEKVAGYEYVDLGLPSGTLWATMNVGASSETDYGNYYQYGKGAAQYSATSGDSNYSGTEDPLNSSVDTAVQVWGGSWHMPTRAQMQELTANTTYQWVTNYKGSGINGGTFTATNGAVLFIPAAGGWANGSQLSVGNDGLYWGSSPNGSDSAYGLNFRNGSKDVLHYNRKYGYSVRGVKNPSSEDSKPLAKIGDVLVHNTILNIDSILSFNDWINANDSWELTGLYGIETFEEEDAVGGEYVIMANGTTLIIKPEDYSKVSNNWEIVDTIEETRVVTTFNVTNISNPVNLWAGYELNIIKSIEVDGVLLNGTPTTYTFTTTGNHIVKYELYDKTKLGNNAPLFYNGNLVECIIPNNVITIGNNTFNSCIGLTSINIPDSVTTIGGCAFFNCTNLTSVTIGSGVTSIGDQAFANTDALKVLNYNAKFELSTYIKGNWLNLETVIIGDSTPSIGYQAFYGCSSLTNVTIGSGVTNIGAHVFKNCSSLTSITSLATTAPTINNSAFQDIKTGGTLTVPTGSTGYDTWMGTGDYYLGKYNWTKVEQ